MGHSTPHADISQSRHWIQIRLEGERCWSFAVELLPATGGGKVDSALPDEVLQDDLKVVGLCGGQSLPDIGYSFHPSLWGQGYATEAIRGFLEAYWETFPIGFPGLQGDERDYLRARTDARNRASIAVLRKLGFEFWKEEEEDRDGGKDKVLVCIWRLWRPGMVSEMVVRP